MMQDDEVQIDVEEDVEAQSPDVTDSLPEDAAGPEEVNVEIMREGEEQPMEEEEGEDFFANLPKTVS